jgi:hypothetical protein
MGLRHTPVRPRAHLGLQSLRATVRQPRRRRLVGQTTPGVLANSCPNVDAELGERNLLRVGRRRCPRPLCANGAVIRLIRECRGQQAHMCPACRTASFLNQRVGRVPRLAIPPLPPLTRGGQVPFPPSGGRTPPPEPSPIEGEGRYRVPRWTPYLPQSALPPGEGGVRVG